MGTFLRTLVAATLAASASAQDVWVVDATGAGDFLQPQAAVDAADQRDTILIRPGIYDGFTVDNKALQILRDGGTHISVRFTGLIKVNGLPAGRDVWIHGLRATYRLGDAQGVGAVGGVVLLQDCWDGAIFPATFPVLDPLVVRWNLSSLVLVDCHFDGFESHSHGFDPGGIGLFKDATDFTRIAAYDSVLRGGTGADGGGLVTLPGGDGGAGVVLRAGRFYQADTQVDGGSGGWGNPSGVHGPPFVLTGSAEQVQDATPPASLALPAQVTEGQAYTVTVTGPVGAHAVLLSSETLQTRELVASIGVLALRSPLAAQSLGTIPAGGTLQVPRTAQLLPVGDESERTYYQLMIIQTGSRFLAEPHAQVVLR